MADERTTIKELRDAVAAFEAERDWRQFHSPKNLAMGIAIETAELMEHFLWASDPESQRVCDDPEKKSEVCDEIADVFCYILNLALVLDIDLSDSLVAKLARNAEKYPADAYRGRYKI